MSFRELLGHCGGGSPLGKPGELRGDLKSWVGGGF